MLIDAPVLYNISFVMLFILTLYRMTLAELTSSIVKSFITTPSQSESELVSVSCITLMSCSASSME